jgi:hypothetical protein
VNAEVHDIEVTLVDETDEIIRWASRVSKADRGVARTRHQHFVEGKTMKEIARRRLAPDWKGRRPIVPRQYSRQE